MRAVCFFSSVCIVRVKRGSVAGKYTKQGDRSLRSGYHRNIPALLAGYCPVVRPANKYLFRSPAGDRPAMCLQYLSHCVQGGAGVVIVKRGQPVRLPADRGRDDSSGCLRRDLIAQALAYLDQTVALRQLDFRQILQVPLDGFVSWCRSDHTVSTLSPGFNYGLSRRSRCSPGSLRQLHISGAGSSFRYLVSVQDVISAAYGFLDVQLLKYPCDQIVVCDSVAQIVPYRAVRILRAVHINKFHPPGNVATYQRQAGDRAVWLDPFVLLAFFPDCMAGKQLRQFLLRQCDSLQIFPPAYCWLFWFPFFVVNRWHHGQASGGVMQCGVFYLVSHGVYYLDDLKAAGIGVGYRNIGITSSSKGFKGSQPLHVWHKKRVARMPQ